MIEKVAAKLHLYGVDEWSPEGRQRIADWLRRQADFLMEHGDEIAPSFRARYKSVEPDDDPGEKVVSLKKAA